MLITTVDAQPSLQGAILVTVIGEMSLRAALPRKFVQTFLLAEQPNGYFVLNDVLRFLKEEEEEEAPVEREEEKGNVEPQEQPVGLITPKGNIIVSTPHVYKTASAVPAKAAATPWSAASPAAPAAPAGVSTKIWSTVPVGQDGWGRSSQPEEPSQRSAVPVMMSASSAPNAAAGRYNGQPFKVTPPQKTSVRSRGEPLTSFTTLKTQRGVVISPTAPGKEMDAKPPREKREKKPRREGLFLSFLESFECSSHKKNSQLCLFCVH